MSNKKSQLLVVLLIAGAVNCLVRPSDSYSRSPNFELKSQCPKGFELVDGNRCELRSLYQYYDSTQGRGVGGTHTGLPTVRDGFSPQQIDLGRYLFFDPILSKNGQLACSSCHDPNQGFTDGQGVSVGFDGELGMRSAPTLWNAAFLTSFFWDARVKTLEQQMLEPLYSNKEMSTTPENLMRSLQNAPIYVRLFEDAFSQQGGLELNNVYTALAAFQTSLISLNSRYDQYAHGNHNAMTKEEIAGFNVFRSFVARCSECHTPPTFTNNQLAVIGAPEQKGVPFDAGAEAVYEMPELRGAFKVPTLRNIEKTAPYMHSGVFDNLRDATEFYNKGRGHAAPEELNLKLHWHITSPDLTDKELDLIVAFMRTLTDEKFLPEIPQELPSGLRPVIQDAGAQVAQDGGRVKE